MKTLVFLHTAGVHVQNFEALLRELCPGTNARHVVREDLLAMARETGADSKALREAMKQTMKDIGDAAEVLCTCSTVGGVAESAGAAAGISVHRIDRAMAERAVEFGSNIVVAAALESTLAPTEALIIECAARAGVDCRMKRVVVNEAWPLFERGDIDGYLDRIAAALQCAPPCDVIVLAQASMAGAAERCPNLKAPVLASPRLGLEAALARLG
ncbi:MAG: hypothetical protein R3174_14795 [Gammaproteobacteria bacterium]|nr:hypothetical protein [Gammaproteobacteria bacterium]